MPNRTNREGLFDLVSYARRGPGKREHFSPAQIEQIARTTRRTPEVMVKVLPRGATSLTAVQRHLDYIGRKGELDLEIDDGETLRGNQIGKELLEDWDLDLEDHRRQSDLAATRGKGPPRLVYKMIFSMPAGTPPQKVLTAVQNFCREELALKHRYAMTLHTDEPHPHVHVVIKAMSEQGQRLHIRKATLREWRSGFAHHLRALGVAANATPRSVRGQTTPRKLDGIYRANLRSESTHMRERAEVIGRELSNGGLRVETGKAKLHSTRNEVRRAWLGVSESLIREGHPELAAQLKSFVDRMPMPRTEKEYIAAKLLGHAPERRHPEHQVSR